MDYYRKALSAERLKRVYETAPPRIKRYLDAEIEYVLSKLSYTDTVLELGCGYGRVLGRLAARARCAVGIDTSRESLLLAQRELYFAPNCRFLQMDAASLGFEAGSFDLTACVQNGISAFHVDRRRLVGEAIRVTKPGGLVLFSSYADAFWNERLAWFRLQAEMGLVGEIDEARTGNGEIVCRDGFTATTVRPEGFRDLTAPFGVDVRIFEIDGSSVFCEIRIA
jgi:SAM-dependent methyltransferase